MSEILAGVKPAAEAIVTVEAPAANASAMAASRSLRASFPSVASLTWVYQCVVFVAESARDQYQQTAGSRAVAAALLS